MTELNYFRKDYIKKMRESFIKFNAIRENFRKKEKKVREDLEKAGNTWQEVSKRFPWWQSLP